MKIKEGVQFKSSFGGAMILSAMKSVEKMISREMTITSGADGLHFNGSNEYRLKGEANPDDPHYHGDAYDFRSHNLDAVTKQQILANLNNLLPRNKFYFFLESPGTANEHFHIQVKKGTEFTIQDFLSA